MQTFDTATYRRAVLTPILSEGKLPDYLERYLLDPGDDDQNEIEARLDEIKAFWDREQSRNPKYADAIARLQHEHLEAKLRLCDPDERRLLAEKARSTEAESQQATHEAARLFEQRVDEVTKRAGGLTPRDRRILEEFARGTPLSAALVAASLDRRQALNEDDGPEPLPESTRADINRTLANYAGVVGIPGKSASLFHFLGFPGPDPDRGALQEAWDRAAEGNRTLPHQHPAKNLTDRLLALAKIHLLTEDPRIYIASIVVDVREKLRPFAADAAIDDGAIDDTEAEQLINMAQEHGLPASEGRSIVRELARDLNVELILGAPATYVSCGNCNRPYPADAAPERCQRCGEAMFHPCPKCGARCAVSNMACASCGTDLSAYQRAQRAISEARRALEAGRPAAAAAAAAAAVELADDPEVRRLAEDAQKRVKEATALWQNLEQKLQERQLYAAIDLIREVKRVGADVPGMGGQLPQELEAELASRRKEVEARLGDARAADGPEREHGFARILAVAADCREAELELGRIAPAAPAAVEAKLTGGQVEVTWARSISPGNIRYRVLRATTGLAGGSGTSDVAATSDLSATDTAAPAGSQVRYGIVAERAGISASTAWSQGLLVAKEVEAIQVVARDGEVHITWEPVSAGHSVEAERVDETDRSSLQTKATNAGLVDRDVVNGHRYRYTVRVAYPLEGGKVLRTEGRSLFAVPAPRPTAISDLRAEASSVGVSLRFTPPEAGNVRVLRCAAEPSGNAGDEIPLERLAAIGTDVRADHEGALDPSPDIMAWYLPVTVGEGYAVRGQPIRHLALPAITDVKAIDLSSAVRVTWSWPDGVRTATVVWRRDRQPSSADDEQAQRFTTTVAQYSEAGGVDLAVTGPEAVFIAVYPTLRIDGESVTATSVTAAARTAVRRTAKLDLRYEVRRLGLRKRQVELQIVEPDQGPLPELLVVARSGDLLPRTPGDGRVVAQLGGEMGARQQPLELAELGRPVAVRVFFAQQSTSATHRLFDPDTSALIIR
jgi:HEPN domain-containing protein